MNRPDEKAPGKGEENDFSKIEPQEIDIPQEFISGDKRGFIRMVYEDELRKVCGERKLKLSEQHSWITFRKSLPINRWLERSRGQGMGKSELKGMKKELEKYLEIFAQEAKELDLTLDMERNYYREAVSLLSKYKKDDRLDSKERKVLKKLMIMVDNKDARLAYQILQSIV
ncbi:MAG TPA: hypothetical protein VM123_12280 [archaeon]|nr:hypothetical protein [archaeon]